MDRTKSTAPARLSRRALLTSAPAAAVTVLDAPAVATPTDPHENAALLALDEELPRVEQAYRDALTAWQRAWNFWSPQWPLAPEACCNKFGASGLGRDYERDLRGASLRREGQRCTWTIKSVAEMESEIVRERKLLAQDDKRKRSYGKEFRKCRHEAIAEAELGLVQLPGYLAEVERIKRESGFEAIDIERHRAANAVITFARRVLAEESRTIGGVRIKASACAAINRLEPYDMRLGELAAWGTGASLAGLLGAALIEAL